MQDKPKPTEIMTNSPDTTQIGKIKVDTQYVPTHHNLGGFGYKAYTYLVAIANYSKNDVCVSASLYYLSPDITRDEKKDNARGEGSFMSAILKGDFSLAINRASGSNYDALVKALANREIEV